MRFTITAMSVTDLLARGFSLLFARLPLFLAIEVIVVGPTLILQLALPGLGARIAGLLNVLLLPIGTAATLHVIAQEYMGQPVSLGEALRFSLTRFFSLLITMILLIIFVVVGFSLCVLPGVYMVVIWAFWSQVVVMENASGWSALARSSNLVSGFFWRVAGVLLLVSIVYAVATVPVTLALAAALPFQEPQANRFAPPPGVENYVNFAINEVAAAALDGIGQIFISVCTTLLYFDLRNRKEAFDVEHIVRWMDQYRDWRDEPAPDAGPPVGTAAETGIKQVDEAVPPAPPAETGIQSRQPDFKHPDGGGGENAPPAS